MRRIVSLLFIFTFFVKTVLAAEPGFLERPTLLGDYGGLKSTLNDHGIFPHLRLTQFYQGLVSGDGEKDFEYGGKLDLLLNIDASKFKLWDGLSLTIHAEANFGEDVNSLGGVLFPVNTALFFPGRTGSDRYDLSSVFFGQKIGDRTNLLLGKINMIDLVANKPFMGGAGIEGFQHMVFAAPPSGLVPPYILGGILSTKTDIGNLTFAVYDPEWMTNKTGFEHPFEEGVTFMGGIEVPVTIAGRTGTQGFKAAVSTKEGTDLRDMHKTFLPPEAVDSVRTKGTPFFIGYNFDQYIIQNPDNPNEGWGVFGQISIIDGNPTPFDWYFLVGLGGNGLIPNRSMDNFGIGYFRYSLSSDLNKSVKPIVELDSEEGIEIFYNYAHTPWMGITTNLMIIDSGFEEKSTATFLGLRVTIKL